MRKVTSDIANAFIAGKAKKCGNTETDGETVYLHGNVIAQKTQAGLMLTLAYWPTTTTRERLNGILSTLGRSERFAQRKGEQVLCEANGEHKIDDNQELFFRDIPSCTVALT